jgi:protein-tyrosine phosphatase
MAFQQICAVYGQAQAGERIEVGCIGGMGRTGTVLACFVVLCGLEPRDAIEWVRSNYDIRAIETSEQEQWVVWFASRLK